MMATSLARFMPVRNCFYKLRIFNLTTSNHVSVFGCERPSKRSVHTSPTATTTLSERRSSGHLPFWTPGSGYYGQTLGRVGKQIVDDSSDVVLRYLDTVPVRDDGVFTVADYGTNDGSTSMTLMDRTIGQLRKKHGEKLPIQIIYEDQEKNDFNSLFNRLSDGTSYLSEYSNVYPFATNVNFYKQCVPDGTCDVIYTSFATQFLDNPTVNFKDGFFYGTANADSEELYHFFAKAEQDWTNFLLLRAKELKKGGLLIALNLSSADDFQGRSSLMGSEEKRKTAKSPVSIHGTHTADVVLDLDTVWRQLRQEHIITQEEYESCFYPAVHRNRKEMIAPFEATNGPVIEAGLSIVHHDQSLHRNVLKDLWREKQRTDGVGDRAYFAELVTKSFSIPVRSSFLKSLSNSRSADDKETILNELFERFEARVAVRDPETYRADLIVSTLVARKV